MHRLYDYRGIILFNCSFDKNKNVNLKNHTFYKCLIDSRDINYINTQNGMYEDESKAFLKHQLANRKTELELENFDMREYVEIYNANAKCKDFVDYVSSEYILPYKNTEKIPIDNDLFEKYLVKDPESTTGFSPSVSLKNLESDHQKYLELSDVYIQVSHNIKVTCIPFFMGEKQAKPKSPYWWKYILKIENLSNEQVILKHGFLELIHSIKGIKFKEFGKDKEHFIIDKNKGCATFQYSGNIFSHHKNLDIEGKLMIEQENGHIILVKVPSFQLKFDQNNNNKN